MAETQTLKGGETERGGSGVTFTSVIRELNETSARQFEQVLTAGRVAPKMRAAMVDAFRDGMNSRLRQLVELGAVKVLDDSAIAAAAEASK